MAKNFRLRPGDIVARRPRSAQIAPVRVHAETRTVSVRGAASPMLLVYGFLGLVVLGTALLVLPIANVEGGFTPFTQALFTCVSAVTVTGLIVVDTAEAWTAFGQVVILGLVFVGGLGFMTGAAFIVVIAGQRLSLSNRLIIMEGLGGGQLGAVTQLVRNIVVIAVAIQVAGAVALFLRWYVFGELWAGVSLPDAIWHSIFHSVTGFNNSGIEVLPDERLGGGSSLVPFRYDVPVLVIMGSLIVVGGLGYVALRDLVTVRRFSKFRLESKMILVGTVALILVGVGSFLLGEWKNIELEAEEAVGIRISDAFFHSVSARTAGFSTIDYSQVHGNNALPTMVLMFIGGASASTAGGIKITTFLVVMFAVVANVRGRSNVAAFGREIPLVNVRRAFVVTLAAVFALFTFAYLLIAVQDTLPFRDALFEAVSAFATVGLSMGITSELNEPARIVIVVAMFLGRLGPITLALLMTGQGAQERVRLVQEGVRIG